MKQVMVIDDSIEQRLVLKLCLSDEYHIVEAGSGHAAAIIFEKEKFDLIISDLQMPNGDGLWFLNHLRGMCTVIPPVIIISGKIDVIPNDILNAGAIAYFSKPFNLDDLRVYMRELLA